MGPLTGIKIIEMAALGPVPWCAMMLSDMGAEVTRIDRAAAGRDDVPIDFANRRGRRSIAVDLRDPAGLEVALTLIEQADAVMEGAEAARSGAGQVIDAAMIDGTALLGGLVYGWQQQGSWHEGRESNIIDGGSPSYGTYETSDGKWVAVSANEPEFYRALVKGMGIEFDSLPPLSDRATWPRIRERFADVFRTRTRDEWVSRMASLDTCFSPVLSLAEAYDHEHNRDRGLFIEVDGILQPGPAPRFSRTPGAVARGAAKPGQHSWEILVDAGFDEGRIAALLKAGAVVRRAATEE